MARKNTLRYILLGLLSKKKMTGYELNQSFKNEIGEFWQAKHSQIYPELAKMEEEAKAKEAEAKEIERQNSTPVLLKEIRDLLKENSAGKAQPKKEEKKSK